MFTKVSGWKKWSGDLVIPESFMFNSKNFAYKLFFPRNMITNKLLKLLPQLHHKK